MLSSKTRKRILERKWSKYSNTSMFFKRRKIQAHSALDDLTLMANNFEDAQLQVLFPGKKIEMLIYSLINSKLDKDRKFMIEYTLLVQILDHTEKLIQNKLLKGMYKEHKNELRKIIDSIYREKRDTLGIQTRLTSLKSNSKV